MEYRNYHYSKGPKPLFDLLLPEGVKAIQSRDEREQGRDGDYAYGLVDDRGNSRRLVMAAGAVPVGHLQELADRARDDEPELVRPGPRPDWGAIWETFCQWKADVAVGRRRYYQSGNRSR